jgi:protocatechuate 3,4-dioxygenase beta subunit
VSINGNTTFDINLPVVKVSGIVTAPDGNSLPNATVQLDANRWDPNGSYANGSGSTTTNVAGYYEILGFASAGGGSASLTVRPPAGVSAATMSESGIVLTGDLTRNIALAAPTFLTGTVRGYGGAPVANVGVTVYTPNWQQIVNTTTDANGQYSVALGSGTVILQVQPGWPPSGTTTPTNFSATRSNVSINGNTTFDINLPVVKVSGAVTDSNGAPVPGVSLQLDANRWDPNGSYANGSGSTTTNAQGYYEILGFASAGGGSASLTVRPPASSGFTVAALSGLSLTGDLTQRIILQHPDLSAPQIVAGPLVVHLSDTSVSISWTTNEPATSRVDYGLGGLTTTINDNALTTNHTVTLLNLTPVSTYTFRVGSVDSSGNGPTFSAPGTFNTQAAPGDVTPPVFTDGPTVVFVDQTTAIVQWTTDEPSTSVLDYGLTNTLGNNVSGPAGTFVQTHSITLTGLSSETTYFARATSADPDDNHTSSSLFSFTTLAVPDTTPPVITGPFVVSKTDTQITLTWTTNEPATSGVSYNDGTHFNVVSDSALTKTHQITLSGLTAQTTYGITVSSTDTVGNGPTLSAPGNVTTNATPDTTPPVISNLQVTGITTSSAVISWTTDEAASSSVSYGTVAGAPDNSKADVNGVTTHSLTLTGLLDGTRYYLTVSSADASGNTAASGETDFKTVSAFIDMPPTAPGPITAPVGPTRADPFSISWGASTDDVGLTGYDVLRDGQSVASVAPDTTSFTESGLPEGTYTYQILATDTAGHTVLSGTAMVIVDRTAPTIAVLPTLTVDAIGLGATVGYNVSATDNVDAHVVVSCSPASGTAFPVGTTTVKCTASDTAGNRGTASFDVTVRDVTPPLLRLPADRTIEATSASGAAVSFEATAQDVVDGAVPVTCSRASGTEFPLGPTTVSCTAEDATHNVATGTFVVTVVDTTPPVLSAVTPSVAQLWPPNHQLVRVNFTPTVSDAVGAVCSISQAVSSEPDNGTGDGDTANDTKIVGALRVDLRAERDPKGGGRTYTITVRCADAAGNAASKSASVFVPKSQGK